MESSKGQIPETGSRESKPGDQESEVIRDSTHRIRIPELGIFALFLVSIFGRVLFANQIFALRDIAVFVFPLKHFVLEQMQRGILPLWNPYVGCGTPFQAEIQSHVLYPLSLIFFLFPLRLAFNLFIIIHFLLAGLFMYRMMREFQYNSGSALLSALTFMFSGYLVSLIDLTNNLASLIWMPLILLFTRRFISHEKARTKNAIWLGIFLGIQFLGGEPQYVLMTLGVSLAWIGYEIIFKNIPIKKSTRNLKEIDPGVSIWSRIGISKGLRLLGDIGIAGLVFMGVTAFQLLPFLEYIRYSTRAQGFSYTVATKWSLPPWQLLQLILPRFFEFYYGYFWGYIQTWVPDIYMGIVPIFLIYYGLRSSLKEKTVGTFFAISLTIFVLLSLGNYFPAYPLFYHYLKFDTIRYPVRFFAPAVFFYPFLLGKDSGFSFPDSLYLKKAI
ncbi:MAG TPA: hypothetical protein VNM22_14285 [Candidatus Limnocylindrales bacterium]|nr:hypothetical protein [Candidatus Limnocylindrales bacterium]